MMMWCQGEKWERKWKWLEQRSLAGDERTSSTTAEANSYKLDLTVSGESE